MLVPLLLLVLLGVLAWLQYRWTGALSRAEATRLEASLDATLSRFSNDFDDELARPFRFFAGLNVDELPEALAEFRHDSLHPEIVKDLYVVRVVARDAIELSRLDPDGSFVPASWPKGLEPFHERLRRFMDSSETRGLRPRMPPPLVSSEPLALVLPTPRAWGGRPAVAGIIITLDREEIVGQLLPALVARDFGAGEALVYDVVIRGDKGEVVFSTTENASDVVRNADGVARLLSLSRAFGRSRPRGAREVPPEPPPSERLERTDRPERAGPGFFREMREGRWEVFVRHRAGSVEAAVLRVRRRNLAVGFGVLLVLGVSMVLVLVSARRATELSERKMEFVAGVSHELRTPLAVIRSAAQNLADGSVSGREQTKRYGGLIESEGRRLEDLVEQVLELAGAQSQNRRVPATTIAAREIVEAAVSDVSEAAEAKGVPIEVSFGGDELFVRGDVDAVRRALSNLVQNAIKHGGEKNRVTISLVRSGKGEVVFTVEDEGPGVSRAELDHIFEAFYRGSRARDGQVPGSGLGLSVVQNIARQHGGRVEVTTSPGKGSRFSLVLPEAPPEGPT